ncbi:MAG: 4Fe-4S dicluster domain-containing protein [Deltaproteobacteria bacterium]|nr:4Fe-4S dicluster domain-containing protein [Deltaproteobacteria bacterium]
MEDNKTPEVYRKSSTHEKRALTRREFIMKLAIGGGSLVLLAGCGAKVTSVFDTGSGKQIYSFIAVDYSKCTGCRTCEAVCTAYNNPLFRDGRYKSDLGNPVHANIRVHSFNPDVDVPVTCARCDDIPCVNSCPVKPDPVTNRRALYQSGKYDLITNDTDRCIGCGNCVSACADSSVGILSQNPATNKPMRMCTLCGGDPKCLEYCPYEALSVLRVDTAYPYYRMSPEDIAEKLNKRWYNLNV